MVGWETGKVQAGGEGAGRESLELRTMGTIKDVKKFFPGFIH